METNNQESFFGSGILQLKSLKTLFPCLENAVENEVSNEVEFASFFLLGFETTVLGGWLGYW